MLNVVGTMFIENEKLLICKPRSKKTYQMIGGKVEKFETPLEAAIRESREELGENIILDKDKFQYVMDFFEIATSDPNQEIQFYVFKYNGNLKGDLMESEEIENFLWYNSEINNIILSNTLKNEVVPYCLKKKLIK